MEDLIVNRRLLEETFAMSVSKCVLCIISIVSHLSIQNLFPIHFSGSTSPCEDKVVSGLAATYKGELWFKNEISVSFDACSPDNVQNNGMFSTRDRTRDH